MKINLGRMPIHWKITILTFFIVFVTLLLLGIFLVNEFIQSNENELKERAMITARNVSELPGVLPNMFKTGKPSASLNNIVEKIRMNNKAEYIVILNMDHERLTHPLPQMRGTISKGDDEGPAFAESSYTSKARGEIGTVIRAFVPIIDKDHQQAGVVIAGYRLPSVWETLLSIKKELFLIGGMCLFLGGWGAWLLAAQIKKQMFYLEPYEIARLVTERTETFNAMHEGIIAIDSNEKITLFNRKAYEILGINGNVISMPIREVLPDTYLPEILEYNQGIYNKDLYINNRTIISNRFPIIVKGETIGAIAVFQDSTEVRKLAEELTGVKAFVSALRAQTHEYLNKLHTIAGLIQLGKNEAALEYVFDVSETHGEITRFLSKNIKNDSISGLLLSKISRGTELGILVSIDRSSTLQQLPDTLDHHDLVLILGNLIENAFDSFKNKDSRENEIYLSIQQTDEFLSILAEDNGCGISEKELPHIFEYGFSSKRAEGHGIGLFLINQIIEKGKGDVHVDSAINRGTAFTITFPMKIGGAYD